jgi:GNAT superfamily N-acetyltransferase
MDFKTGCLKTGSIQEALRLVYRVFDDFVGRDYSEKGRAFFKSSVNEEFISGLPGRNGFSIAASEKGKITGIISVRDRNHIALFFVDAPHHRRGIGKRLFNEAKRKIAEKGDVSEIDVYSSPCAVPVYKALGFTVTEDEKEINGMKFVPMKHLIKENGFCDTNLKRNGD